MGRSFVSLSSLLLLAGLALAQDASVPSTPLEQCQQDLRAQILDYRQCQASCANAQYRSERLVQTDVQMLLAQREKAAQEKYDKLKADYDAVLKQKTPSAAQAQ